RSRPSPCCPPSFPFCDQCGPFCLTPQDQVYLSLHPARKRKFADSPVERNGFELPVPREFRPCSPPQMVFDQLVDPALLTRAKRRPYPTSKRGGSSLTSCPAAGAEQIGRIAGAGENPIA